MLPTKGTHYDTVNTQVFCPAPARRITAAVCKQILWLQFVQRGEVLPLLAVDLGDRRHATARFQSFAADDFRVRVASLTRAHDQDR